jgi:hypothetical protein
MDLSQLFVDDFNSGGDDNDDKNSSASEQLPAT